MCPPLNTSFTASALSLISARAEAPFSSFAEGPWGQRFPTVLTMWRHQWEQGIPFLSYPQEVRSIIYTTNAIESQHMRLRKIVKSRGHFPSDEAATKLLYLPCAISKKIGRRYSEP